MAMRFGAAFWVQGTGWPDLREAILRAEAAGYDDLWIDDHLLSDEGDWHSGKLEGWTTLAAVAAITSRARLGLMVAANTLRNPGLTAKMATTLDHVSGGRAILGIGAGWFEREHEAFGFDFGSGFGERLDRLAEAVPLMRS
jgi:alkanesulfonate monooxygenase SsuD/methylene tetrahydromethanopterin reductase-like flavin-dependent oxidoreductase (luciferase family)